MISANEIMWNSILIYIVNGIIFCDGALSVEYIRDDAWLKTYLHEALQL